MNEIFIVRGDDTSASRDAPWRVRVRGGAEADDGSVEGKSKTPLESIRRAFGGCSAGVRRVLGERSEGIRRADGGHLMNGRRVFGEWAAGIRRADAPRRVPTWMRSFT